MPANTVKSELNVVVIDIPAGETLTGEYPFSIEHSTGYFSGLFIITSKDPTIKLSMSWRSDMPEGDEGRFLPVYIDLATAVGVKPDFALFTELTNAEIGENNYYIFFVHPETPAAVPLLVDQDGARLGLTIRIDFTNTGQSNASITAKLILLHSELT